MEDSEQRKINASFMLIDYQKSYDSVPHLWVNKILELYNIGAVKQGLMNQPYAILVDPIKTTPCRRSN